MTISMLDYKKITKELFYHRKVSSQITTGIIGLACFSPSSLTALFANRINLGFWETAHLPLPYANIYSYFSFRAKCWLRGGVDGQIPRNLH